MAQLDLQLENYSNLVWNVADFLHGAFNDDEYGNVILPFALLRRVEAALEPTRQAVYEKYQQFQKMGLLVESQYSDLLAQEAKAPFFNVTRMTLETVSASNTLSDMDAYLNGFSANLKEIFEKLNFLNVCKQLQDVNLLYITAQHFKGLDFSPARVPARVMSNIYEELIWKFAASKHKASKEFLTPRDVVRLATTIVLDSDDDLLTSDNGQIREIYDPTCGTCGFINDAMELINEYADKSGAKYPPMLVPFGQDISPSAWALGKTMMLLRSMQDQDDGSSGVPMDMSGGVALGNTLTDDKFADKTFDYVFSNPPFGMDWSKHFDAVSRDYRFATVGLPPKSDGSMLFLTHVAKKLNERGRGAIVLSGSPLFNGGSGSGSSEIRRWLLENDLIETIIQLPGSLFYNTAITTYLWILNRAKPQHKKGKVQLIDASDFKTLIKNVGTKRFIVSDEDIARIARLVSDYQETDVSQIKPYTDFGYRDVTVQRPLRLKVRITEDGLNALGTLKPLQKLDKVALNQLKTALKALGNETVSLADLDKVVADLKSSGIKLGKPAMKELVKTFGVRDPNAEPCKDDKGYILPDTDLTDTEVVPLLESLDDYMVKEVLPHVPDAYVDGSVCDPRDGMVGKVGYEIGISKYFYKYKQPEASEVLAQRFINLEDSVSARIARLFKES